MHAHMISYLVFYLLQDLYEESQARVGALERQLAALQVADDEEEKEEGAKEGADEDRVEGDDEDATGEEDDGDDDADEGGDVEE